MQGHRFAWVASERIPMSHLHRFYAPEIKQEIKEVVLSGEEGHHAVSVARLRVGNTLAIFNGCGLEGIGRLAQADKKTVTIKMEDWKHITPPPMQLTLAVGGLHRDKAQEEVVRRAAELGAVRVCFFSAERSQRPIKLSPRWVRAAVEACKQCGRSFLPVVDTADSLDALLSTVSGPLLAGLLTAEGEPPATVHATDRLTLLIGPEGDFSPREETAIRSAGAVAISLGRYTYRSETAATLLATLVAHQLGELGPGIHLNPDNAAKTTS
jgi:16S rRNA (uracil1498-N3)-methyltransferase